MLFYFVKKFNNAVKVFLAISSKLQIFCLFFLVLLEQFILVKDLFYHSVLLNIAELLIYYTKE